MTNQKPRYISFDGHIYVSKEHMAERIEAAIISAFSDGFRQASGRTSMPRLAAPIEEIVAQ